jgi:hypothetical protein
MSDPALVLEALYAGAYRGWSGGLKRGGGGRRLADWLTIRDLRELADQVRGER